MTLALLLAAGPASAQTAPPDDGRVYYALDIHDDVDEEMARLQHDDWARPIADLQDVRGYREYAGWVDELGLATRPAGQIYDGQVGVSQINVAPGQLAAAIAADALPKRGRIFAEELVPGLLYTEHVVYFGAGGPNLVTAGAGFVMRWLSPGAPKWEEYRESLKNEFPATWDEFVYAEETLEYTGLPDSGEVNQFASTANALFAFEVRQEVGGDVVGWMMRERRLVGGVMKYVDHWALTDDFERLGQNGGDLAIVTPDPYAYASLGDWLKAMNSESPLPTTYARVAPHAFGPLGGAALIGP